jgi:hypothetical protein
MPVGSYLATTWIPVTANRSQSSIRVTIGIGFPKALVNLRTKDGNIYAVLVGIHRGNVPFLTPRGSG